MTQAARFKIIRKLDQGGMAEVYQAETESLEGFRKTVAVKKVLPHLVQNEKFLRMFLDEARLGLRMSHANVVQVFDVGASGGSYFVIMEFVDGTNLKAVTEFLRNRNTLLPIEQAIYVMVETCKGLQYAHTVTDQDGRPLGIVHRDVSPPNILMSKQGEVKLVDFGLAKAADQLEHTDPGVVKGKFSYLSPEAAEGREVDHRTDVFAVGILLWEALTGRRLFFGKNDYDTVQQVRAADVAPPSSINPAIPRDLDRVVLRALARDRDQRYGSAQELGDDLYQFLFSHGLKVTSFDIANLVKVVLREATAGPAKPVGNIIDQLIETELARLTSLEPSENPFGEGQKPLSAAEISGAFDGDLSSMEDPRTWANDLDDGASLRIPGEGRPSMWHEPSPGSQPPAPPSVTALRRTPFAGVKPVAAPAAPAEAPVEVVAEAAAPRAILTPESSGAMGPPRKSYLGLLVGVTVLLLGAVGALLYLVLT